MNAIELVVFDMAGTTIEDGDQVPQAFEAALRKNGIEADENEIQERMGASKREVFRFFVERQFGQDAGNPERIERVHADFSRVLIDRYADGGAHPITSVKEVFAWLHERRIRVALTTGFDREVADTILEAAGWRSGTIDASLCSDDVAQGRPAPFMIFRAMESTGVLEVDRVAVVGDTVLDLQAGANAGARGIIGVLSGSHGIEQLGKARHTHLIPSVAELPDLIENEFT